MPSIAKFMIMFSANASGVNTGVSQAQRSLGQMEKAAASTDSRLRMMAGGTRSLVSELAGLAVGAITVQKLSTEFLGAIDRLDQLGDKAEAIGETAQNIDQLAYAAVRMGSSSEAVDKALGKLIKSVGEVYIGTGKAGEAFTALGLDIDQLMKLSPAEAFVTVASALAQVPTQYERAALGAAIFGKGANELNSILKMGGPELEEYLARYEELNAGISDGALTAASDAQDAIDDIKTAYQGLTNVIVEQVGPGFTIAANSLAEYIAKISEATEKGATFNTNADETRLLMKEISVWAEAIGKAMSAISNGFSAVSGAVKVAAGALGVSKREEGSVSAINQEKLDKWMLRDSPQAREIQGLVEEAKKPIEDTAHNLMRDGAAQITEAINKAEGRIAKASAAEAIDAVQSPTEVVTNAPKTVAERMEEEAAQREYEKALKEGERIYEENMTAQEKYNAKMEDLNDKLEAGVISLETFERASTKAWEELERSSKKAKGAIGEDGGIVDGGYDNGDAGAYGIDPVLQQMIDFSMPRAGFAGDGSMPANWRLFSPPEMGPRQSIMARDVLDGQGVPYFQNDTQAQEQTNYLRQIAQNTAAMGVPA